MRCATFRGFVLVLAAFGCSDEALSGRVDAETIMADARADDTSDASPFEGPNFVADPGPPAKMYGPKCLVTVDGVSDAPGCISAVVRSMGETLHLFLNFCVRNGHDECNDRPPQYVSLVLPLPGFVPGVVRSGIGGRVSLNRNGHAFEVQATPGQPIPLHFEVKRHAHMAIPEGVLRAELTVQVPARQDGGGMMNLHAEIN